MPRTSPQTKHGRQKLSELAKHLAVPNDIASTMWPSVLRTCTEKLGAEFDDWQDGAGRVILAKREDGTLAAMVDGVGMSLPRQVGKTHLIGYLTFALCVNIPGLLVIWTAHHSSTSGETFLAMQGMAQRAKVAPHVKQVFTGSGDEEVRFHNGSRILFGARERGFGRGIPGVDVLIFDEAQILSDRAMSNMLATMNTSRFGLQLYIGTPPKPEDMSETFKRMRREALAGTLVDGAWIEFGAQPGDRDDDRAVWRRMNPSFPKRTPAQSLMRLKRKLTPDDWRREGMGIWDDDQAGSRVITAEQWEHSGVAAKPDGVKSFGVAFSIGGDRVSLAGVVKHEEGFHAELVDAAEGSEDEIGDGLTRLADWLAGRWRETAEIVVSGSAHAGVLAQMLRDRGVPRGMIRVASTPQYLQACATLVNAFRDRTMTRLDDPGLILEHSAAHTDTDKRGGFVTTVPDGDETPMEAVALAVWAASTTKRRPRGSNERKAVFL